MEPIASGDSAGPTRAQIRRILALSTRAPSAGNMQPWRFVYRGDGELEVLCGAAGKYDALDHQGRVTAMTLGGLLELIAIAATTEGYDAEITLDPASGREATRTSIRFRPRAGTADPLARAIEDRFTDRRDYLGGSLFDPVFAQLRSDAALHPDCRLHLSSRAEIPAALVQHIVDAEVFFWAFKPVQHHMLSVTRWTDAEAARTQDGVIWRALGLSPTMARVFALYHGWPLQAALNRLGFLRTIEDLTRSAVLTAAGLGLITARKDSFAAFIEASRLHTRTWLRLQDAGYALQPLATISIYATEGKAGQLPPDWPAQYRAMFTGGMDLLRRTFDFPEDEWPVWLFRAGKSPGPPIGLYTHRYDLDRVLTFEG